MNTCSEDMHNQVMPFLNNCIVRCDTQTDREEEGGGEQIWLEYSQDC